jgi:hypothetical protein
MLSKWLVKIATEFGKVHGLTYRPSTRSVRWQWDPRSQGGD